MFDPQLRRPLYMPLTHCAYTGLTSVTTVTTIRKIPETACAPVLWILFISAIHLHSPPTSATPIPKIYLEVDGEISCSRLCLF